MQTARQGLDGLTLLQEHNPAALEAYLHLLGTLGSSLDPKTKQLLLIALQVTQDSPRALRKHVPRALQAGATPAEVLDAILLTLPVTGLTRTVEGLACIADLLGIAEPAGAA